MRYFSFLILTIPIIVGGCNQPVKEEVVTLDTVAESYVKLALNIGHYDYDFINAYYGPKEWEKIEFDSSRTGTIPFEELKWVATDLLGILEELDVDAYDSLEVMRYRYLHNQLIAVMTKLDMMAGDFLPFDVESRALYDAVAPHFDEEHYDNILKELHKLLPGSGSIQERYEAFSAEFIIPAELLDPVFQAAIKEARKRTSAFIELPENENFSIEYVTNKPWTGYNWYKGNSYSLIELNTDLPIYIEMALDLACHEGYPGHYVYNTLLEKHLVDERGWIEFSVYPLFTPQSFIAEGTAVFGIEMAFPGDERREFERDVLFPLAGIDPAKVDRYYDVQDLRSKLDYATNEAAMMYLNGQIGREEAAEWLMKYNLLTYDQAIQRTNFIDSRRSYVINYSYGKDLVKNYIERNGGVENQVEKRWDIFKSLLSSPVTASMLE